MRAKFPLVRSSATSVRRVVHDERHSQRDEHRVEQRRTIAHPNEQRKEEGAEAEHQESTEAACDAVVRDVQAVREVSGEPRSERAGDVARTACGRVDRDENDRQPEHGGGGYACAARRRSPESLEN